MLTALTAQNTRAVTAIFDVTPEFVARQIDTVFEDIRIDAVKIGMLSNAAIVEAVADRLGHWKPRWIVLDPVMVAKSGDRLLDPTAVEALRTRLLPLADLITPNLPEAAVLLGEEPIRERARMGNVAARLQGLGAKNVLLKGGHLDAGESPDLLLHGGELYWLESERVETKNTHGTGCTLSSAVAAFLARRHPLPEAVALAKRYLTGALRHADELDVGHGHGPVHHFWHFWPQLEGWQP
ncbi:Hydroxymethylpyrimidine/phosphomethylpyrimidine kinase [bacterium HR39]|nr:Hydroxymethylpyrimidine/phosphomethylpyrimidine kinase [bacterium HR39]